MNARDTSFLSIWGRRAIAVPLYLLMAALVLLTAPLWALAGLTWDVLAGDGPGRGGRKLPRTRALGFFALYFLCEAAGILAATGIWIVTLGGRIGSPRRFLERNAALQRWWSNTLFFGSVRLFSMKVATEGVGLVKRGPFLLFVRHASMADTVLAAAFVANPGRLLLRYVLKRELLWDPCLDIVGRRLPNAFVNRRGPGLDADVAAVAGLAEGLDESSGVLIYPEGKRFSDARREAAVNSLEKKGEAALAEVARGFRNVLPPRLRGPLALMDAAKGVDVVFMEHTGFEGAATLPQFWNGSLVGGTLHVRLRRIPASAIPPEGRERWLFERWAETDRWISEVRAADPERRRDP